MGTASQISGYIGECAILKGVLVGLIGVQPLKKIPVKELVEEVNMVGTIRSSH